MRNDDGRADAEPDDTDDGLAEFAVADGPWDIGAAPDELVFVDLGALKLPALPGLVTRLEYDHESGEVGAVTVGIADCVLQVQVVAKHQGGNEWASAKQDLLANLSYRAGSHEVVDGRWGPEVVAVLQVRGADGELADATMRFQGIERETWMIRAVSSGPSVTDGAVKAAVDAFLSACAVDAAGVGGVEPGSVVALTAPGDEATAQ